MAKLCKTKKNLVVRTVMHPWVFLHPFDNSDNYPILVAQYGVCLPRRYI